MSTDNPDFVTALARGLQVLQVFDADHAEMTLAEIATRADVAPATARRSLVTLKELGFVAQNGRRFLLTPRVLKLSASFLSSMNLQKVAQQYLQGLMEETGDSCSMAVLDQAEIVYLASATVKRAVRLTAGIGTRYPAYATSLGRILLAHLPADQLDVTLAATQFRALTANTVTDEAKLRSILLRAREDGYASVCDELDYGVLSVAVPLKTKDGRVLAAVNCSTSPSRIEQKELIRSRVPLLRDAARQISAELEQHPALVHAISHQFQAK